MMGRGPSMGMQRRAPFRAIALAGIAALLVLAERHSAASGSDVFIRELLAGSNGDSRVQFIVIEQSAPGENLWGPQGGESQSRAMLVFFDRLGRETGKFKFPFDPATGGTRQTLVATRQFAELPGAPSPDILIPPLLSAPSGKVCFRHNPSSALATPKNDCVVYGAFTGEFERPAGGGAGLGPPAPELSLMNAVSLRREANSGLNSDFVIRRAPAPVNLAGASFTMQAAPPATQGESLFRNEAFSGNGRVCASCHVPSESFGLPPADVQSRFASLVPPVLSYDPLFIGEKAPSGFDAGFDFNLNTLVLTAEVGTAAPCTGELRGVITSPGGARARVLARTSPTTYLVYGGLNPQMMGTVSDGTCDGVVERVRAGDLSPSPATRGSGIEDPARMRRPAQPAFPAGRSLILENIDGFANPPVFRKSPHLLNLRHSAPYGLSGEFPDLRAFTTAAVIQHFPRTLARRSDGLDPDFRLPSTEELAALEAFMLGQEFPAGPDPNKFDLARFATTEMQRKGLEDFVVFGCAVCHGGPALNETTIPLMDKPVGVNAAFNTGTADSNLPCEPASETVGPCGSREFSTPQLFNLPRLGPFFHNGLARTLADAVEFYRSSEFGTSPAGLALVSLGVGVVPTEAITAFLEGLVARPYSLSHGPLRFGAQALDSAAAPVQTVTLTNTGSFALRFSASACRIAGADAAQFVIVDCPLQTPLAPGGSRAISLAFDPDSTGLKRAILEVYPVDEGPSGIDLFGVGGALGRPPALNDIQEESGAAEGGDAVLLNGLNFVPGATVTLGGVPAGFVDVVNATTMSARTGAHTPGVVDVEVINPDGQTALLRRAFTYVARRDGESRP